ncbi:GNAT family N-acetyltransferase [Aliikangiella sp. G2MR2-5]|uniref:GNAT family N-acetyltransferase n=1 Tax=Aliikangiella sp. G2MR2-5 TaxID=2788943 RepID=UPI0018A90C0D|nr:GNAT family N-acetyltransferase [Aliikangiella sp. G2MR2-5]
MNIEIINKENSENFQTLVDGVRQFNYESAGKESSLPLSVIARCKDGNIIGGVSGRTIYKHFLIEVAWVDMSTRGTGLGKRLMFIAEEEARNRGCIAAQVDTLSFQAPGFYQKCGFDVVGEVPEIKGTPGRFFLLKQYE